MDKHTLARIQDYLGKRDAKGRPIDVIERVIDARDRTREFYVDMAKEMYGYLYHTHPEHGVMINPFPEQDFRRKTGLLPKEFNRRLKMLGIERPESI